jgi:hypothetical protein
MPTIYVDPATTDESRRHGLYAGDLYVMSPTSGSAELCALARELSEQAFAPHDPQVAQETMLVEDYVAILAELKPGFIHHPKADYDYDEWNPTGRKQAREIVKNETRRQPRPEEPLDFSSEIRIVDAASTDTTLRDFGVRVTPSPSPKTLSRSTNVRVAAALGQAARVE